MKDTKTVLLILLSAGLTGTWVYHLYDKTRYQKHTEKTSVISPVTTPVQSIDSLRNNDVSVINGLSAQLDIARKQIDSLQSLLSLNLNQHFSSERKQMENSHALEQARKQIADLQINITALTKDKNELEKEKTRLNNLLAQLSTYISNLQQKDKSPYR